MNAQGDRDRLEQRAKLLRGRVGLSLRWCKGFLYDFGRFSTTLSRRFNVPLPEMDRRIALRVRDRERTPEYDESIPDEFVHDRFGVPSPDELSRIFE